jgi:hypothetical protein
VHPVAFVQYQKVFRPKFGTHLERVALCDDLERRFRKDRDVANGGNKIVSETTG